MNKKILLMLVMSFYGIYAVADILTTDELLETMQNPEKIYCERTQRFVDVPYKIRSGTSYNYNINGVPCLLMSAGIIRLELLENGNGYNEGEYESNIGAVFGHLHNLRTEANSLPVSSNTIDEIIELNFITQDGIKNILKFRPFDPGTTEQEANMRFFSYNQ